MIDRGAEGSKVELTVRHGSETRHLLLVYAHDFCLKILSSILNWFLLRLMGYKVCLLF